MNALNEAVTKKGAPQFDVDGILKRGVVVRHLILPQNTNESINIINNLKNISSKIVFSLMSQYTPFGNILSEFFLALNYSCHKCAKYRILEYIVGESHGKRRPCILIRYVMVA